MSTVAELRERVREFARVLVAEQGRVEAAPGVALFTVLEDVAVAVGDAVAEQILEQELAQYAEQSPTCPQCGQPGLRKGERKRVIQTRRGEVSFVEPECYCPRCRRAFFPSFGNLGFGRGLRLQSAGLGEDHLRQHAGAQLSGSGATPGATG